MATSSGCATCEPRARARSASTAKSVAINARELEGEEAVEFFGVTLPGYVARFPWFGRAFARLLFGLVGKEVLDDPAARGYDATSLRADTGSSAGRLTPGIGGRPGRLTEATQVATSARRRMSSFARTCST